MTPTPNRKPLPHDLAQLNGVPMLPGSDLLPNLDAAKREANRIGYPIMLKVCVLP